MRSRSSGFLLSEALIALFIAALSVMLIGSWLHVRVRYEERSRELAETSAAQIAEAMNQEVECTRCSPTSQPTAAPEDGGEIF